MSFKTICDNWITELQANVAGLSTANIPAANVHKYASWSMEAVEALGGERHLAIWPDGDPEVAIGFLAGSPPSDKLTTSFSVLVWEDMSAETGRRFDDDVANAAWLDLYEAVRARFYISANTVGPTAIAGSSSITHYRGGQLDRLAMSRYLGVKFTVESIASYS